MLHQAIFTKRCVGAPAAQQRSSILARRLDVGRANDDDLVIASREAVLDRALQGGQRAIQPGAAGRTSPGPARLLFAPIRQRSGHTPGMKLDHAQ